ncbi:hypothetical protein D3C73_1344730 [compost metagenome]
MPTHDRQLLIIELALLEQHRIGNGDLAHVVQRRSHFDQLDVVFRQAQLLGDQARHARHPFKVGTGAGITELDRTCQPRKRLALALLHLMHAGQQPLLQ